MRFDDAAPPRARAEAARLVAGQIDRLRADSYEVLRQRLDCPEHEEVTSAAGKVLILETVVFWDLHPGGDLRVIVDVWAPRARHRRFRWWGINNSIATDDFIRASDGSFVGEASGGSCPASASGDED